MNRQKTLAFLLMVVWLFLLWQPSPVFAEEGEAVEAVTINIVINPPVPQRIVRRIEASIRTVGERLIVGREIDALSSSTHIYENLIQDVLDRVLAGYTVQKVTLVPGSATTVTVVLEPWGERVRDVQVTSEFSSTDKLFVPMLQQELGDLGPSISAVLLGLPVESLDWADTVAKNSIREMVEERLPEYRAAVDLIPGERTQVRLIFSPIGAIVREAVVSVRSESIPNVMLYEIRPGADVFAKALRGLPVDFVARKQTELTDRMEKLVQKHPYTESYQLNIRAELVPGPDTEIKLKAESRKYRINAEARLDMGRFNANTSGLLHAGKFITPDDELFVEIGLITNSMKWEFSPGWGRRVGPNTVIGARINVSDNIRYAWLEHNLGENWRLRFDRSSLDNDDQIGIRYKLHDFLSAELVHRSKENFVRVIGQL